MKSKQEALRIKEEQQKHQQLIDFQRDQEQMKNESIKNMIRDQKRQAEEKRAEDEMAKRMEQRNRLINSILEENQRRMQIEERVAELEKEEYDLIQRLQNTSNIQK
jgi:hypothetical protein